ncbi:IS256 family transposase [Clostridium sp. 'deep sea']|uniref:IS256 family transposase n=1 Tax=Clostridium sp. 'deep sea' TaxID=2779445 RepID=UPI0018967838|nr:IS256 family transposase [Clostridium sp. 'deep sea']QOR36287.1 IS256 family transposase [Clostridium sp. 'deep sea']
MQLDKRREHYGTKKRDPQKIEFAKQLIQLYKPKTTDDVANALKDLLGPIMEDMLEEEMNEHLGYDRYSHEEKENSNRRNGVHKKSLKSSYGEFDINVPRDRDATFEPEIVPKGKKDISQIEQKIINMYAKGTSTRDISDTINDMYGVTMSHDTISNITDKIMDRVIEWQNRDLNPCYPFVFVDCMYLKVKDGIKTSKRALYTILGYDLSGKKDILGVWIGEESESAHYWLNIFQEIKERGVEDIFIISMDGLTGLEDGVKNVYPQTLVQRCLVHLIRNSLKFVPSKDFKEYTKDLKTIYNAVSLQASVAQFDKFKEKWSRYNGAISVWERNWIHVEQLFQFSKYIRKVIYTTNAIESIHSSFRKVTKNKGAFPNDQAVIKLIYLRIQDIKNKWNNRPIANWEKILNEFMMVEDFKRRIEIYL